MSLLLTLPSPPTVNGLYRNLPGRGRVKTSRYRAWEKEAGAALDEQWDGIPVIGEYVLHLLFERPDKRRRDLLNMPKAVEDLLVSKGVIQDDSLNRVSHLAWSGKGSSVEVVIEPMKGSEYEQLYVEAF